MLRRGIVTRNPHGPAATVHPTRSRPPTTAVIPVILLAGPGYSGNRTPRRSSLAGHRQFGEASVLDDLVEPLACPLACHAELRADHTP